MRPSSRTHFQVSKKVSKGRTHVVIGDTQCRPGVPTAHLGWIGRYIVDQFAGRDVSVIHLGDHYDMPSLSLYDRGKKAFEGRRYRADIDAGNEAFDKLCKPLERYNASRRARDRWHPDRHLLLGNHEARIARAVEDDATLEGTMGYHDFNVEAHGWKVHPFLKPVRIDGVAYCLAPHHKVLTRNLEYKTLADVRVGDELLAFEDGGKPRKFVTSTVLAVESTVADLFRVTLENKKTFDVTADHRWLVRKYGTSAWKWVHTRDLTDKHETCKPFGIWEKDDSHDSGWLAGIFDGEGCLSKPNGKQGGIQLSIAQNKGVVLDRVCRILASMSVEFTVHDYRKCQLVRINGTSADKLKLLGRIGATRLIQNFRPEMLGRVQSSGDPGNVVVAVEAIPGGEIVQIQTTSGTLIVDGYAHHNCHYFYQPQTGRPYGGANLDTRLKTIGHSFTMGHQQGVKYALREVGRTRHHGLVNGSTYLHEEKYLGPQTTSYWRGVVVCHQVERGSYDPMFISLDYLCRRYERKTLKEFLRRAR